MPMGAGTQTTSVGTGAYGGVAAGDHLLQMLRQGGDGGYSGGQSVRPNVGIGNGQHSSGHGYGQGQHGPGYGQAQQSAHQVQGTALKDLLAQVAPQATITESQLNSRASARILGKVLNVTGPLGAPGHLPASRGPSVPSVMGRHPPDRDRRRELPEWWAEPTPAAEGSYGDYGNFVHEVPGPKWDPHTASSASTAGTGPPHQPQDDQGYANDEKIGEEDEEEDSMFMQRWSGLFSKSSPLLDVAAEDPFKEDLAKRSKVVWKKNSERNGHHKRYQQRRQKKHPSDRDGNEDAGHSGDEGVDEVYDARKRGGEPGDVPTEPWVPRRPPAEPQP